jgi:retinol dehydrogenase 12
MATGRPMEGRTCVVTGATSGIGYEIAKGLAVRGARTVLVGRGPDRLARLAESLARSENNPNVDAVPVRDIALRAEWGSLSAQLLERYPRIHVLVNNAGAFFSRREVTEDGLERTFALNVLAPLALTTLLADRLKASAPARVVNIASAAHRGQHVDLGDLEEAQHYRGYQAYGRSKLELILLTRELARRFAGSGVTVNAVHPGFIRSGFGQNNGGGTALAIRFFALLGGKSPARGARTPLHVATDPSLATVSGEYFSDERVSPGSPASRDPEMARRLFDSCQAYLRLPGSVEPSGR